jgi:hypothetical protein
LSPEWGSNILKRGQKSNRNHVHVTPDWFVRPTPDWPVPQFLRRFSEGEGNVRAKAA